MGLLKTVGDEIGEFLGNLWGTAKALVAGRKATMALLSATLSVGVILTPSLAEHQDKILAVVNGIFGVLIAAIAVEDGLKGKAAGG